MFEKTMRQIGELLTGANSDVAKLKRDLEAKKQRREDLLTLSLPREDFIDWVCNQLDVSAEQFPKILRHKLGFLEADPMRDFNLINFNPLTFTDAGKVEPSEVLFCFKDAVKQGIADAINTRDWPADVGPARAERQTELKKLDKEIESLQGKWLKYKEMADRHHVDLGRLHSASSRISTYSRSRSSDDLRGCGMDKPRCSAPGSDNQGLHLWFRRAIPLHSFRSTEDPDLSGSRVAAA